MVNKVLDNIVTSEFLSGTRLNKIIKNRTREEKTQRIKNFVYPIVGASAFVVGCVLLYKHPEYVNHIKDTMIRVIDNFGFYR